MYPAFYPTVHCFLCSVRSSHLVLEEDENAAWLSWEEQGSVDWFLTDMEMVKKLEGKK